MIERKTHDPKLEARNQTQSLTPECDKEGGRKPEIGGGKKKGRAYDRVQRSPPMLIGIRGPEPQSTKGEKMRQTK